MLNKSKMIHYAHCALYRTQPLSNRRRRLSRRRSRSKRV